MVDKPTLYSNTLYNTTQIQHSIKQLYGTTCSITRLYTVTLYKSNTYIMQLYTMILYNATVWRNTT